MENIRPSEPEEVETVCEWCDDIITWSLPKKNEFGELERENKKCGCCGNSHSNTILFELFKEKINALNEPTYTVNCPYCEAVELLKPSPHQASGNFNNAAAKCKNCDAIFNTFYDRAKDTMATSAPVATKRLSQWVNYQVEKPVEGETVVFTWLWYGQKEIKYLDDFNEKELAAIEGKTPVYWSYSPF